MASRSGPVHCGQEYQEVQRQRVLDLSSAPIGTSGQESQEGDGSQPVSTCLKELIFIIKRYLRGEAFAGASDVFQIDRSLPHGHVAAVLGTLRGLQLDSLLGKKPEPSKDLGDCHDSRASA